MYLRLRRTRTSGWPIPGHGPVRATFWPQMRRYGSLAAVEQGSVYSNNAKVNEWGGNDYWETGVANPDLVLADLIKIFHPDLLPEHEKIWFHQLQ